MILPSVSINAYLVVPSLDVSFCCSFISPINETSLSLARNFLEILCIWQNELGSGLYRRENSCCALDIGSSSLTASSSSSGKVRSLRFFKSDIMFLIIICNVAKWNQKNEIRII